MWGEIVAGITSRSCQGIGVAAGIVEVEVEVEVGNKSVWVGKASGELFRLNGVGSGRGIVCPAQAEIPKRKTLIKESNSFRNMF